MIALPGGKGYFEIKTEGEGTSRGARKPEHKTQIVAYFYQSDGTTVMSPAPTDVRVKVGQAENSPVVTLTPESKGAEASSGRFACKPGPYPEGFQGQLDLKLNGEPIQATFLFR
jgi:hypothetical protein